MKLFPQMLFTSIIATAIFSCSSPTEQTPVVPEVVEKVPVPVYENFETGKVLNPIFVIGDTIQNYALYLPKSYSKEKKYPIIYFLDPHAAGHIPIDKYYSLAEKYGFIIIGNNVSENGMKLDVTNQVIQKMIDDSKARISIDPSRIYACGFSGGSRVVSNYAITVGGINGVVACGAGISTKQSPKEKFSLLGIAGNEDFNYTELKNLDLTLVNSGWSHYFMEFNGKHEWPPVETMDDAFIWLDLDAMRNNAASVSDTILKKFVTKNEMLAAELQKNKKLYEAYRIYEKLAMYTYGLNSDSTYLVEGRKLEESKDLLAILNKKAAMESKEDSIKKMYAGSLNSQNDVWWDGQIKKLNSELKTMKDKDEVLLRKRVLSYLSLAAYMSASGAVKFGDFANADHFLKIYEGVDPTNAEHAFLRAIVYAKQNQPDLAMASLRKAVGLGFSDLKRMICEPVLLQLKTKYHEFDELVETVKANALKQK